MSSDGRYMYHQPAITPNYDYSPYPPPPPPSGYDNSQITQPPPRSVRTAAPPQAPSSHQPYNPPPPPPYPHPAYGPNPYMAHPQQPPQWSGDAWAAHYQQSYVPPPPPPPLPPAEEASYNSVPARPDPMSSSSTDPRSYSAPPPPEPRRVEERLPPPQNPPPQGTPRRRDRESPPAAPSGTPTGLDFTKLLESYRLIIDVSDSVSGPGRPPAVETFERMLQSATCGAQILESTTSQQQPPPPAEAPRSPKRKEPEEVTEPVNGTPGPPPAKRPKTEETSNPDGQKCEGCGATSTPEWRRGPLGPRTLCNACGLVYAKLLKKRFRENTKGTNGAGPTSQGVGEESVDGDSDDDDDEYASQGPHSDGVGGHRD